MTNACHKKCVPPKYHENDLTKGESVCIDRCVAKYFEIHDRIGKKLTAISTQQAQAQITAAGAGAAANK
jgi:mitochondrial import inner membrane translocase subunit TIM10